MDHHQLFQREAPLWLELGCGKGQFSCQLAADHPEINLLALDIRLVRVLRTCQRAEEKGLSNLRGIHGDALILLPELIPPQSCQKIFINYPDPWPKRKQQHRRFVTADLMDHISQVLKPEGRLHVMSDHADYSHRIWQALQQHPSLEHTLSQNGPTQKPEHYPESIYEQKMTAAGEVVYYIEARKADVGAQISEL